MKKILLLVVMGLLFISQTIAQQDITVDNTINYDLDVIATYKYNGSAMQYIWDIQTVNQITYEHPADPNYVLVEFIIKGDGPPSSGNYTFGYDEFDIFYTSSSFSNYGSGYYDAGISDLVIDQY